MSRARNITDKIPGGRADTRSPKEFDQKQLKAGVAVEMEHVNDKSKAREIAMDHLAENPKYYTKLTKVHLVDEPKAKKLLELFGDIGGANLRLQKDSKYLQCRSCGYIATFPSGVYGTDALGDTTRAPLLGEKKKEYKCEKCGGPMDEVHFSSARVMGGQSGPRAQTAPGGAYQGGAYH